MYKKRIILPTTGLIQHESNQCRFESGFDLKTFVHLHCQYSCTYLRGHTDFFNIAYTSRSRHQGETLVYSTITTPVRSKSLAPMVSYGMYDPGVTLCVNTDGCIYSEDVPMPWMINRVPMKRLRVTLFIHIRPHEQGSLLQAWIIFNLSMNN